MISKAKKEKRSSVEMMEKSNNMWGTLQQKCRQYHLFSKFLRLITYLGAAISVIVLAFLVAYILIKGIPHITPELFAWTVVIVVLSVIFERGFLFFTDRFVQWLEQS